MDDFAAIQCLGTRSGGGHQSRPAFVRTQCIQPRQTKRDISKIDSSGVIDLAQIAFKRVIAGVNVIIPNRTGAGVATGNLHHAAGVERDQTRIRRQVIQLETTVGRVIDSL